MSFDKLPNEPLVEIFRHVVNCKLEPAVSAPPKDLAALLVCCRRFYDLAQPQLYSKFSSFSWGANQTKKESALFRTIVASPNLARYVKHFGAILGSILGECPDLSFLTGEQRSWIRRSWMPDIIDGANHSEAWHHRVFSPHNYGKSSRN